MPQVKHPSEEQPEQTAAEETKGTKEYVLDKKATVSEVVVDNKTLSKDGKPVALNQDQYDRASAVEGVKLAEASEEE